MCGSAILIVRFRVNEWFAGTTALRGKADFTAFYDALTLHRRPQTRPNAIF